MKGGSSYQLVIKNVGNVPVKVSMNESPQPPEGNPQGIWLTWNDDNAYKQTSITIPVDSEVTVTLHFSYTGGCTQQNFAYTDNAVFTATQA